ncbi:AI-2E family transporter [Azospirillum oryzae]|uniref:AI-2E family transporter n=1 Tax=Azospirillum oryzae TaxID=286727 RepID=A0A6N1AM05_9PROT|nr:MULTISPECIES: AI-2E family transporter [Azospirillum]KAA0580660.1 AI-2E family transporter [Azospirillum sp. Sh1]KAA0591475.1 AI-2E family transporter [Azospirillum oryzae]QKS52766.1 AI-2E family transporter [Azospirillum oryzae]GLR80420.1 AI-2E family transporter [Azospirillum oryzae]
MTDRSPLASLPPAPEAPLAGTPEPATEPLPGPGHRRDPLTIAAVGLFVIAVLFTLYFGRDVLLPIMLALILSFLLRPLVRALYRVGMPEGIGAAVMVVMLFGGVLLAVYTLSAPAAEWVNRMPRVLHELEFKLGDIRAGIDRAREASRQIEQITKETGSDGPVREVVVRGPTLMEQAVSQVESVLANVVILLVLLYFFLARGRHSLEALIGTMRNVDDRVHYAMVAATLQQNIAAYLLTITVINAVLGLATGLVMWMWGLPNPALWGVMVALANYIPFIGPAVMTGVFFLVSVLTFDSLGTIILPPLSFVALTTIEGNFLTPMIVGRRLSLNPIAVFVSILFWGWLWGIPGALLAVPILAILKILFDAHEPLKPVGALLGD